MSIQIRNTLVSYLIWKIQLLVVFLIQRSWSLPAHTSLLMVGFTLSFYYALMGSTVFWMYRSSQFPSDSCSTGTLCRNSNSHFLPLLASRDTLTFLLMGSTFHWQQCTVHGIFLHLLSCCLYSTPSLWRLFVPSVFCPLPSASLKNLPKPRNLFCLKYWIKLDHPGLFPALKQIFKTASLFSSAKSTPLMSDFQASSASASSCFNSYDQIFGLAQDQ